MEKSESPEALNEFEALLNDLTSTSVGRRAFLAAVPMLMAACASDNHREREGDNTGQETQMTVADEKRMTAEALPEMRKDYPAIKDPQLQAYLTGLGTRLVTINGLQGNPYTYNFTLVDVPMVNAFALPAGTVFVTAPLFQMAESEAELAGVVGHEIGHVKARHAAERIEAQQKEGKKSWLYGIGGGLLGGVAGFGLGKLLCPPNDNSCMQKAMVAGAAAGVGGGLLVQKYKFMANSREDEMEADRIGFKAAVKAGYAPQHVGDFYSKLQKMEEQSKASGNKLMSSINDAMATHPPSKERVAQMEELVGKSPVNPNAVVSSKNFDLVRSRVDKLLKSRSQS